MEAIKSVVILSVVVLTSSKDLKSVPRRESRLFSNLFGLLGHSSCQSSGFPKPISSGVCYNEVECILRGGKYNGYCGPPAVKGVCCVFIRSKCDSTIDERIGYFTNPSYPFEDTEPTACTFKVKPSKDTCWVRFDLEELKLQTNAEGVCLRDFLSILNSAGGMGGQICGNKKGFVLMAKAPPKGESLLVNIQAQSPHYKWNIRVTQIGCDEIKPLQVLDDCGKSSNPDDSGNNRPPIFQIRQGYEEDHENDAIITQVKRKRKLVRRKKRLLRSVTNPNPVQDSQLANSDLWEFLETPDRERRNLDSDKKLSMAHSHKKKLLLQRKLGTEAYFPAYSTKNVFCKSKFRLNHVPTSKIIDGTEAPINAYPWIVSLQYAGEHFCGGSLINNKYIMTAAHCLEPGTISDFVESTTIRLGDHDLVETNETQAITRRIKKSFVHWTFNSDPGTMGDFALILMDEPVQFTGQVSPICLPEDPDETYARMLGIAAGWGVTEDGEISDVLRQVELNIIPNVTCVENLAPINIKVDESMICTFKGPRGTESICSGDSGGPLMVRSGGKFTLVGLTSFSVSDCAAPFPGVFSRITYYLDWAAAVISSQEHLH